MNDLIHQFVYIDEHGTGSYNYSALCQQIHHSCMIDGGYILADQFLQRPSETKLPQHGYLMDGSDRAGIPEFMFGKHFQVINETWDFDYSDDEESNVTLEIKPEQIISTARLLRIRYTLNVSTPIMTRLSIGWERQIFRYLTEEFQSNLIDIYVITSTSINDSIMKRAHQEGPCLLIMVIIFLVLSLISILSEGNSLTSIGILSVCTLINIVLCTGSTFGLLTIVHIDLIEPMSLLIIVVISKTEIPFLRCSYEFKKMISLIHF